jgi:hypothetical protein
LVHVLYGWGWNPVAPGLWSVRGRPLRVWLCGSFLDGLSEVRKRVAGEGEVLP